LVDSNNQTGVQLSTCIALHKERLQQRFAYLALQHSTGAGSIASMSDDPPECSWEGVACSNIGRMTDIYLGDRTLKGSIPADVGLWTSLMVLELQNNELTRSLPSSIGAWTGMMSFDVSNNRLNGTLPTTIGTWSRLRKYAVNKNGFVNLARIPNQWTALQEAYLQGSQFQTIDPGVSFCPATLNTGTMSADCTAQAPSPPEVFCPCCNICCDGKGLGCVSVLI
jgi:hypothetical protein